jgi:hypothetical protein
VLLEIGIFHTPAYAGRPVFVGVRQKPPERLTSRRLFVSTFLKTGFA